MTDLTVKGKEAEYTRADGDWSEALTSRGLPAAPAAGTGLDTLSLGRQRTAPPTP